MKEKVLLNENGQTEEEFLKEYDATKYERPSVTVDTLIFTVNNIKTNDIKKLEEKELKVLLIKRGNHPYIGQWALPGGFAELNESLDETANRELKEETGIDNVYMEQLYTYGDVKRDPRYRVISTVYMSLIPSQNLTIIAGDDAIDAKWFLVKSETISKNKKETSKGYILEKLVEIKLQSESELLSGKLKYLKVVEGNRVERTMEIIETNGIAFDHIQIIQYGLDRLKNKIEYTDIAFNLMNDLFTLTELQKVYEIILNKKLTKANFRRKIKNMVLETEQETVGYGHRPAKLYKFNPAWDENEL